MARARNIKPGFFSNEFIGELSFPARLLLIGLWTLADREGRLEDRPRRIHGELFRYDNDIDVDNLLEEIAKSPGDFVRRYEVGAKRFVQINNWHKHQKPHHQEKPSEIPPYTGTSYQGANHFGITPEPIALIPDRGYLIPDTGYHKEDSPTISFIRDIQKFTGREPYKSLQYKTAEYRNAISDLNDLISEHGYEKVLQTARDIHADDKTAYSIFQFAWMIPKRLKGVAEKRCQLSDPANRFAYWDHHLEDCGCSECVVALERRAKKREVE